MKKAFKVLKPIVPKDNPISQLLARAPSRGESLSLLILKESQHSKGRIN